ncbi:MAG: YbaB/EbfC family nucleoid-associated protein [Clostridiales bacterium]|jgi:DNA-binding YbaB/EbfC family protein|nr:YbaB/EbfC family nucleoid-associated protein [Clostridiales bacterium]
MAYGKFPGGPGGMGGGMNIQQMMKQAQKMQEDIKTAQGEIEEAELTGTSGGGMVTVVMSGKKEVKSVTIDKKAVDPDDVEMLEDLLVAALHDAFEKAEELYEEKMGKYGGIL